MHHAIRLLLACFFMSAGVIFLGSSTPAHACSCIQASIQSSSTWADVIVTGTYEDITSNKASNELFLINVDRVYKGSAKPVIPVATQLSSASCGWNGINGKRYLFFLTTDGEIFSTTSCSGNMADPTAATLQEAQDINVQGTSPLPSSEVEPRAVSHDDKFITSNGILAVSIVGSGIFLCVVLYGSYTVIYRKMFRSENN